MQIGWQKISSRVRQLPAWVREYVFPTAIALLFLFLWTQSLAVDPAQHNRYVSTLRQLQELDARVNQDLLQLQLGLLNNYDPIVEKQAKIKELQQVLIAPPNAVRSARTPLTAQVNAHRQVWQEKNELIQSFKSKHAIFQNSLAYFPIATAELSQDPQTSPQLTAALNALLRELLLFNLTASEEKLPELRQSIQQLNSTANSQPPNLSNVLSHASLVLEERIATAQLVESILALPTRQQGTQLAETYDSVYQRVVLIANVYRIGLYALLTTLVIAVAASIVSKLKAAAIAQQQSENTQQALFQAIPDLMMRMYRGDVNYDIVSVGREVISRSQSRHGNLYDILPSAQVKRQLSAVNHVLNTGQVEIYEQQLVRNGQAVWEEVRVVRCGKNDVLVMVRDICDRKQAEAKLQQATKSARIANQAKSQFLSNMSHELRTPLNVILGFAQLMTRNRALNPQQQNYLDSINQSGEHLLNLINDVLEMSKIEAGKTTLSKNDFDLHGLLRGIHTMFQFKASANGIELHLDIEEDLPHYIHTDESKLRQVLINLVGNAVKFTNDGSISLRAHTTTTEMATTGEANISFEVEDTGQGIVAKDIATLFDPFSQAENRLSQPQGTGLGLSISKKFVEMMGGKMVVTSEPGVGSRFCFSVLVDIARTMEPIAAERLIVGLESGQPTYRILIAEDVAKNRELLADLLAPVGFNIKEACNGQEAVEICQQWQPHLVLMDLRMPVIDGYEATRQIKARQIKARQIKAQKISPVIIALTGSTFKQEKALALETGCDDFVSKPFRTETIFAKLAEFLNVRYRYEDAKAPVPVTAIVNKEDLQVMPHTWIQQLNQAATRVNSKEINRLLKEIPSEKVAIASYIRQLIKDFRFEDIVKLTQPKE